jgi:hypothetical protein
MDFILGQDPSSVVGILHNGIVALLGC